jgi:hypothetical protein
MESRSKERNVSRKEYVNDSPLKLGVNGKG